MFRNFNLDEVSLTDRDFAPRRHLVKKYIADFDIGRLMHTFKLNAGLPSDALPLGGWEDPKSGLRGHFAGHYLSACAKFAFGDGDESLKSKAFEIIDIMECCAKPSGYLSAFEEEVLDVLESEENSGVWAPYYTLHKIIQGLVDCHIYLNSTKALTLGLNLAHWIQRRFEKLSYWKIDGILRCTKVNPANEFGGLGDAFYTLYDITGDSPIFDLAGLFDRPYWIDPLADGVDVLDNLHANTHLPMIAAAMHRYNITGEEKYKTAAIHFYDFLRGRTFASGNNSSKATAYIKGGVSEQSEHWGAYGALGDALTGGESESCCAHNTERILERLLEWSGSVEYLEHMESLKYNAVLNSASGKTGLSQYHQPMGCCAVKKFSGLYDTFWCCTASGMEAMSELQKNIWFKNGDTLLLNAFISSTVVWTEKNLQITQSSSYPDGLFSTIQIQAAEPVKFKLMFKEESIKAVKMNAVPLELQQENGFCFIETVFNNQDTIEIEIYDNLQLVPLQGAEHLAAVKLGSVLLAAIGRTPDMKDISEININQKLVRLQQEALKFAVKDAEGRGAAFIPLFRVEEEEYTVYFDVSGKLSTDNRFNYAQDGSAAYKPKNAI